MSLQLKKSNRIRNIGISSAVIIGASFVVLKTFPHLKTSFYQFVTGSKDEPKDDANEPIELNSEESDEPRDIADESMINVNEMSNEDLKSWLKKVCNGLYIQNHKLILTNRKKSILPKMLVILILFPLLNQFKKLSTNQIIVRFNVVEYLLKLLLIIQGVFK